jgi:hypothetical protein
VSNGPPPWPAWWWWVRRVTIFALGACVIVEGLVSAQDRIVELIAGLVMVGVLPLDDLVRTFGRRAADARRDAGRDEGTADQ